MRTLLLGAGTHHDDASDFVNGVIASVGVNTSAAAGQPFAAVAAAPDVFDANASAPSFSSKHHCTTDHGNREL